MVKITRKYLRSKLHYDPKTGIFTWISCGRSFQNGTRAGSVRPGNKCYRNIKLLNYSFKEHHLAFLYMTGRIPKQVDHINGVKYDNSWSNLREATTIQNMANRSKRKNNTSGYKGVTWFRGRWRASIHYLNKRIFLGEYSTPEEASNAYNKKALELHGEFAYDKAV